MLSPLGSGQDPALVAQLDRASDYGSEGWGFESLRARYAGPGQRAVGHLAADLGAAIDAARSPLGTEGMRLRLRRNGQTWTSVNTTSRRSGRRPRCACRHRTVSKEPSRSLNRRPLGDGTLWCPRYPTVPPANVTAALARSSSSSNVMISGSRSERRYDSKERNRPRCGLPSSFRSESRRPTIRTARGRHSSATAPDS